MKTIAIVLTLLFALTAEAALVKDADLAGSWYSKSSAELKNLLEGYLDAAAPEKVDGKIFAIITPHAGYQFSGPVAAYGFKAAGGQDVKTVIVIGFTHRRFFDGIGVYEKGSWRTPLGEVAIDDDLAGRIISGSPRIHFEPDVFREENSVEMEIPFIQLVFKGARIVPIAFGTQDYRDAGILADVLAGILKDRQDVLVVASTDMSHYHPYSEANEIDKRTLAVLETLKAKELYDDTKIGVCELCGIMPVAAALLTAEKLGFDGVKVLKYANSGDTYGDKDKVVGYTSTVIYKKADSRAGGLPMLNDKEKKRLLQIARESITSFVKDGKRKVFKETDPVLNEEFGVFVTLHEAGDLRGCIGNMVGRGPLYKTVADMAIEAATGDPRFRGMSASEIEKVDIEISVLSPLKRASSHEDIKIPGHGVLVKCPQGGGVYLPQVATECRWNKEEFLTSLCGQKAGIAPDAWKDPKTELYIFSAEVFGEKKGGA